MIIFPFVFLLLYRRMVYKIVAQHPEFLESQTMSFDDSGICISNSVTRVQWPWSRVRGVTNSNDFYVFRFDTLGSGVIIPKRALTAQQTEQLLSYANTKVA
ncbi:MAG TPA: YcxB family protein [Chthoniobacterales bacterium]